MKIASPIGIEYVVKLDDEREERFVLCRGFLCTH